MNRFLRLGTSMEVDFPGWVLGLALHGTSVMGSTTLDVIMWCAGYFASYVLRLGVSAVTVYGPLAWKWTKFAAGIIFRQVCACEDQGG